MKSISNNIIKLDMSEYSESHAVSKLIGSPAGYVGYNDSNYIFDKIKYNPFSVIILDEFDKAYSVFHSAFYQLFEAHTISVYNGRNYILILLGVYISEMLHLSGKDEVYWWQFLP